MRLNKNKKVIITGASSGIGKALVDELVARGVQVLGVSRSAKNKRVGNLQMLSLDLTTSEGRDKIHKYVDRHWGSFDVLINNAGIVYPTKVSKITFDKAREIMEINFFAPVEITTNIFPSLNKKGTVVNILSPAIYKSHAEAGLYSASKSALKSISDALRSEMMYSKRQIKVLGYYPGIVRTAIFRKGELVGWKRLLSTSPEGTAKRIIKQIEEDRNGEYFEPIAKVIRLFALVEKFMFFGR